MKKVLKKWQGSQVYIYAPYGFCVRATLIRAGDSWRAISKEGGKFHFRESDITHINISGNRALWLVGSESPLNLPWIKKV